MSKFVRRIVCLIVLCGIAWSVEAQDILRLDLNVGIKKSTQNIGAGNQGESKVESTTCNVTIKKTSSNPYTGKLTAELYVLGRKIHQDVYGVIDVVKSDFTFTQENGNKYEFSAGPYSLGKTSGNINVGSEYETYLLVIVDETGKIVDSKSGRKIGEEGIAKIREFGPLTLFDKNGNVVGKADPDQKAFKRATPAAVRGGRNN